MSSIVCLPTRPNRGSTVGSSLVGGLALQHAARAEHPLELGVARVRPLLGLFLGVQVVEVAEELVEPVHGRQELVQVAEVVLAELAGGVAVVLEQFGDGRVFLLQADWRRRHADLREPGAERALAGDERRPAGRAALLGVVVGEDHPLAGDPVDIGRAIAHQAHRVGADVRLADVVAEDDEDVRLLAALRDLRGGGLVILRKGQQRSASEVARAGGRSRIAGRCRLTSHRRRTSVGERRTRRVQRRRSVAHDGTEKCQRNSLKTRATQRHILLLFDNFHRITFDVSSDELTIAHADGMPSKALEMKSRSRSEAASWQL